MIEQLFGLSKYFENDEIKFEHVSKEQYEKDLIAYGFEVSKCMPIDQIPLPKRSTSGSAGYDFICPVPCKFTLCKDVIGAEFCRGEIEYTTVILPKITKIIPTGIKCKMPNGVVLEEYPRSSLGFKYGISLLNTVGIIDSDYYNNPDNEGHILAGIRFSGGTTKQEWFYLNPGDRFFQGILIPFLITTDDDSKNIERSGGVGSTGV